MVDVECASLQRQQPGLERLTVRLNEYAEKLVLERMGKTKSRLILVQAGSRYWQSEQHAMRLGTHSSPTASVRIG
jgi:hypothetical protein